MSHISKIFEEAPIKVQNRNGFDLSHVHSGTSKTGQLVPVLTKLLAPNTTLSLGVQAEVSLPPLVSPFFGKIDFCIEGFVVPLSILYGGWKQFITNNDPSNFPATQNALLTDAASATITVDGTVSDFGKNGYKLPYFELINVAYNNIADFQTKYTAFDNILDYMGFGWTVVPPSSSFGTDIRVSLLPLLAYHKICDVFYRNTKISKTWFEVNPNWQYGTSLSAAAGYSAKKNVGQIWHSWYTDDNYGYTGSAGSAIVYTASAKFDDAASLTFPDGKSVFETRQRPYSRDYFTSAVASPQQGGASTLKFSVDVSSSGNEFGTFTINSLRAANSLAKFLETNNLSGEYSDMMRNRWGIRPIDADFDEPHYLGRVVIPVYNHTIYQTGTAFDSNLNEVVGGNGSNPYTYGGYIGAESGAAKSSGEGSICDNFNSSCWSYLMCIASLVPHANYNYGLNRELTMTKLGDFPAPELQSVGMEEIKNYEISTAGSTSAQWNGTFGYTGRYSRFKYMDDRTSAALRPTRYLNMYQLQRDFGGTIPTLATSFLEIGKTDLDKVLAVSTNTSNISCWWEIYFNLKVVMPLADYAIPTLGDIQDTHTIKTTQGGSRL